jgi:hypothetical protein
MNDEDNTKEDFCGACLAVPVALIGTSATVAGTNTKGSHKKSKKYLLWSGIASIVLSVLIAVYFLWIKKCSDCR